MVEMNRVQRNSITERFPEKIPGGAPAVESPKTAVGAFPPRKSVRSLSGTNEAKYLLREEAQMENKQLFNKRLLLRHAWARDAASLILTDPHRASR